MKSSFRGFLIRTAYHVLEHFNYECFIKMPGHVYTELRAGEEDRLLVSKYHAVPDYYGKSAHKSLSILNIPGFNELAKMVINDGKTMLYYDRLYTIYQTLVYLQQTRFEQKSHNFAELGVFRGGTSYFIAMVGRSLGFKNFSVHAFDTFEGHPQEDIKAGIDKYKAGKFNSTDFEVVKEYLSPFENVFIHKGRFQDNCKNIQDLQFDFIHLDMDIYLPTIFGLSYFDEHIVRGGVMIVDDFNTTTCPGINTAVEEFLKSNPNYFRLTLLTNQCVLLKL